MSANAVQPSATSWQIDPVHTTAEFKVRHMMITNVKGRFTGVKGVVTLDENDLTKSRVEASIDATSIDTREADRDAHLKSADFLDVESFPQLTFVSTAIKRVTEDEVNVEGDLTIHGITRPVTFRVDGPTKPAKDPWGNTRIGFSAQTKIRRGDFGLTWNTALETGGILVGDEVTITLEVQAVRS